MKKIKSSEFASRQTEMMAKNCALTPDQVEKVQKLNLSYAERCCVDDPKVDLKKYDDERDTELKNIFNKDQYAKWETNKKKWTDSIKEGWEDVKETVKDTVKDVKKNM